MLSPITHVALALLALAPSASANPLHVIHQDALTPTQTTSSRSAAHVFSQLLSLADPTSLHRALHDWHPKFADGAFASDKSAAEAIHKESPALATAILELVRRQDSSQPNSTNAVSSTPSEATSVETVTAPLSTAVVVQTTTTLVAATTSEPTSTPTPVLSTSTPTPSTSAAPTPTSTTTLLTTVPAVTTSTSVDVVTQTSAPSIDSTTPAAVTSAATSSAAAAASSTDLDIGLSTTALVSVSTPPGGGKPVTLTSLVVVAITGHGGQNAVSSGSGHETGTLRDAGNVLAPASALTSLAGAVALFIGGLVF